MTTNHQQLKNSLQKMIAALSLAGDAGADVYREISPRILASVVNEASPEQVYRAVRPYYVEEVNELTATARMGYAKGDLLVKVVRAVYDNHELEAAADVLGAIDLQDDDDWGE